MKKQHKRASKKKIGAYILYGALTVFLLGIILSFDDIGEIFKVVKSADYRYILLSLLCLGIYIALYPLSLCILTQARGCDIKPSTTYNIAMTEHFFNGITPFATGGQPFQVYAYAKAKIKPAESTSLLLTNFMVFMLVTNGFAACSLFYFSRFVTTVAMKVIAIVGFSINFTVLVMTFLVATSHRLRTLFAKIVDLCTRLPFVGKFLKPRSEGLKEYFVQAQEAFANLMHKKGAFFLALLTKILSMAAYYATTFFILRALYINVPLSDMFFIICGTSFAITMVVFMPTPGSSGGIEFAFKTVFASIAAGAASTVASGGMLIWRLLTYYLVMLVSLGFYIYLEKAFAKKAAASAEESSINASTDMEHSLTDASTCPENDSVSSDEQ